MKKIYLFVFLASVFGSSFAQGHCAKNELGIVVCGKTPGAGAIVNEVGRVVTGPGQCVTDELGRNMCSRTPGGGARINPAGLAVCDGGCVYAR